MLEEDNGIGDGMIEGRFEGLTEEDVEGKQLGPKEGVFDGNPVVNSEDNVEGAKLGKELETLDGIKIVASLEGATDGMVEGNSLGPTEGDSDENVE